MTVPSTAAIIRYSGNDALLIFAYTWKILDEDDIEVYLRTVATGAETLKTISTHYTVSDVGKDAGGNITFLTAPATGEQVVLKRAPAITQLTDYQEGDEFAEEAHEDALDRLCMIAQMLSENLGRVLFLAETSTYSGLSLPDPEADKVLAWESDLSAIKNITAADLSAVSISSFMEATLDDTTLVELLGTVGLDVDLATLSLPASVTISAFVKTLLDDADAAAVLTTLGITAAAQTILDDPTVEAIKTTLGVLRRGYLGGLGLSNDTDTAHDILVAAGEARDAANSVDIILAAAMAKQIDATWAAGDDAGGMNDGESVGNATWYHVFLLSDSTGATVDAGFDTSITAANLLADTAVIAAGLTKYRRIGSVLTDGSANIIAFKQEGDHFWWDVMVSNYDTADPGTSRVTQAVSVPLGIKAKALLTAAIAKAATAQTLFTDPAQTDTAPTATLFTFKVAGGSTTASGEIMVETDTSSQICFRNSDAGTSTQIATRGWLDNRGKND